MNLLRSLFLYSLLSLPLVAKTIFVTENGAGDGTSWDQAYGDLQNALNEASAGDRIWISAGTYLPGAVRTSTFQLKDQVEIFGGFSGIETELSARNIKSNPTVLSGDIGTVADQSDNCYHVVTYSGQSSNSTTILDGFIITGGMANEPEGLHDRGAGILSNSDGAITLKNLTVESNSAIMGGGAFFSDTNVTSVDCSFSNNSATNGGAIYAEHDGTALTITRCTFNANTTIEAGGAIFQNNSAVATLTSSTITTNVANTNGGGCWIGNGSTLNLTSCTIVENHAQGTGGGVYKSDVDAISNVHVFNCIISANHGDFSPNIFGENLNLDGANLIDHEAPHLAPLADNGGATMTIMPYLGSPAINGATTSALTTDQRGAPLRDASPDIGSVEVCSSLVSNTNDAGAGSLRETLSWASPEAPIQFIPSLAGSTISIASPLVIEHRRNIDGTPLSPPITINAQNSGRIFEIGSSAHVFLKHITLAEAASDSNGGAILNKGNLTLHSVTLRNNSAENGGGIYHQEGILRIINSTLSENASTNSGGALFSEQGNTFIIQSTFASNTAAASGGAINLSSESSCKVTQSTVSLNTAPVGAGIHSASESFDLASSIVAGNLSDNISGNYRDGRHNVTSGDPKLSPLTPNIEGPATMSLLPDSPALNRSPFRNQLYGPAFAQPSTGEFEISSDGLRVVFGAGGYYPQRIPHSSLHSASIDGASPAISYLPPDSPPETRFVAHATSPDNTFIVYVVDNDDAEDSYSLYRAPLNANAPTVKLVTHSRQPLA